MVSRIYFDEPLKYKSEERMNKTNIEWCDSTWNPVTGCMHGCEYCYARRIAERFGKHVNDRSGYPEAHGGLHLIESKAKGNPYPYIFEPTFLRYRLKEPAQKTKPQTIFVCSMADLFGDWVPDEWLEEVFAACEDAPQHRYLFLTKNPERYDHLALLGKLPKGDNYWYGSTVTTPDDMFWLSGAHNTFISVEPILEAFPVNEFTFGYTNWIILGAMTGPGSRDHTPDRETIDNITETSNYHVFMKDSLIPIVGEENMRREFPWETGERRAHD